VKSLIVQSVFYKTNVVSSSYSQNTKAFLFPWTCSPNEVRGTNTEVAAFFTAVTTAGWWWPKVYFTFTFYTIFLSFLFWLCVTSVAAYSNGFENLIFWSYSTTKNNELLPTHNVLRYYHHKCIWCKYTMDWIFYAKEPMISMPLVI